MGRFIGTIGIEPAGGKLWRTTKSFAYVTDKNEIINIPVGFKFDGVSVPKFAWIIIGHPLDQDHLAAACIHDWLYRTQITTRYRADKIFREALKTRRVSFWKRQIMYYAVRLGGRKAWNKHRKI